MHYLLSFVEHIIISWFAAIPLLFLLAKIGNRSRVLLGALYGAAFYVIVNSLLLPLAFGDSTPWTLGFDTIYPSVVVHLVFGITVALTAPQPRSS